MKIVHVHLTFYLIFVQCFCSIHTSVLEEHDLAIKSLIEENRYLRNAVKELQEKYKELGEKIASLSTVVTSETLVKESSLSTIIERQLEQSLSKVADHKSTGNIPIMARTCHDLTRADPTLENGMYYVDPDGWNAGDPPIHVYCDKQTGETSVLHDSLEKTNVGHCLDPGCYSRPVNYNATMRQMRALMELSVTCDQYIRYDCISAAFAFNDVQYCWWNDRHGEPNYYWDGSNDTVHTCACGVTGDCVEATALCNCDASAPVLLYDEGRITNQDHLPITRLNFGRTSPTYSLGEHTLGPLKCSGSFQPSINVIPTSCADLWRSGETVSGLYQVQATNGAIVTVFCDMSKLPEEVGFQTLIGTNDVKSTPVYFTAVLDSTFAIVGSSIAYNHTWLNIGGAMNIETGKFTAPRKGIYFFAFTLGSTIDSSARIIFNESTAAGAQTSNTVNDWHGASAQATLQLNIGDVVYARLDSGHAASLNGHETHFTGFLLQQL